MKEKIHISGSTVYSVLYENNLLNQQKNDIKDKFILLTLHSPENVDHEEKLMDLLNSINLIGEKVIFIIHPRVQKSIEKNTWNLLKIFIYKILKTILNLLI